MQATVEFLDLKPAAIELLDRMLLDQTRGQLAFQAARDFLELDSKPCESILMIEFYEDVAERLAALVKRRLGLRTTIAKNAAEMRRTSSSRRYRGLRSTAADPTRSGPGWSPAGPNR